MGDLGWQAVDSSARKGLPVTAKDIQVEIAMKEIQKGRTQQQAAAKANLRDRGTVAKYAKSGKLPSEMKEPRTYRTREDPFVADWAEIKVRLEALPDLETKVLFEWLCDKHPGRYRTGQLRTLQRRVRHWRARHVGKVVSLPQTRRPGEVLLTDGRSNPRPASEAVARAGEAKAAGMTVFTIGLGADIDVEALAEIYRAIAVALPCPVGVFWGGR